MFRLRSCLSLTAATVALSTVPLAQASEYGARLEGFDYDYPVSMFAVENQQQPLEMAYIDAQPEQGNGKTVVLLHGKNFCATTWSGTIQALSQAGYRVVAPDQIGFCKSSKPEAFQYSFQQLARNTHDLLEKLGIDQYRVMGHSMGGMLATRMALMYPDNIEQLVLVNPIGLEDWKAKGVPYLTADQWFKITRKANAEGMKHYQQHTYYNGEWRPEFDRWIDMQAGMMNGPDSRLVAWSAALTYEMVYTQPVFYEFDQLKVPTLMLIGAKDNTAIGKKLAPEAIRTSLGNYPQISRAVAERIPSAELILFPEYGHSPQIQAPEVFHQTLLEKLR